MALLLMPPCGAHTCRGSASLVSLGWIMDGWGWPWAVGASHAGASQLMGHVGGASSGTAVRSMRKRRMMA